MTVQTNWSQEPSEDRICFYPLAHAYQFVEANRSRSTSTCIATAKKIQETYIVTTRGEELPTSNRIQSRAKWGGLSYSFCLSPSPYSPAHSLCSSASSSSPPLLLPVLQGQIMHVLPLPSGAVLLTPHHLEQQPYCPAPSCIWMGTGK